MFSKTHSSSGFTLIEVIVSFSVIAILSTLGIAAFLLYSTDQQFKNTYLEFANNVSSARSRSISQVKPTGCIDTLLGYKIYIKSANQYEIYAICGATEAEAQRFDIKLYSFSSSISFSEESLLEEIYFPILKDEISLENTTIVLQTQDGDKKKAIVVDKLGGISIQDAQ